MQGVLSGMRFLFASFRATRAIVREDGRLMRRRPSYYEEHVWHVSAAAIRFESMMSRSGAEC